MLQSISSVFVVYRRKTFTGSPDPTHANGTDKPCSYLLEGGRTASLSCVRACMYACVTCLREGELPACDVTIRTELQVKQDVSFIQVISGVCAVRPTAPKIHG